MVVIALVVIPDFIVLTIASILSYRIRFDEFDSEYSQAQIIPEFNYLVVLLGLSSMWIVALAFGGCYQNRIANYARFNQYKLIRVSFIYFFALGFASFTLNASFSRQLFISMLVFGLIGMILVRLLVYLTLTRQLVRSKRITAPILIIGKDQLTIDQHIDWIMGQRKLGYKIIGSMKCNEIDFDWVKEFDETRMRLGEFEVLLLSGIESDKNFSKFIHYLEDLSIFVNWIPLQSGNLGFWLIPMRQESLPFLTFKKSQISFSKRLLKRCFDIAFALVVLILLLPVFFLVSVAILVSDGRPIFFSQSRIGQNGRPFKFLKFRSMVRDAESLLGSVKSTLPTDHILFKNAFDPRVTKIGKFLRKYSLDELPQFINVLAGNMSVVGPRPALPKEVGIYSSLYERRLIAKPGITGPWQISGRSDLDLQTSISLDLNYLLNWSFTSDLWIILATVGAVLKGRGAY